VAGNGAVPVGVPEALAGRALGEQDVAVLVEQQAGERAVADAALGVGVEAVGEALCFVVGVDGDDVLCCVLRGLVVTGRLDGNARLCLAHARTEVDPNQ